MKTPLSKGLVALALTLLGACGTTPEPGSAQSWEERRRALAALTDWGFSGKVAIRTPRGADSASLRWTQTGTRSRLEVSGPAGLKRLILEREGDGGRVFKDRQWRALADARTALETELGWPLPLEYLPWWLRGLPAPDIPVGRLEIRDERLVHLSQAGWTLEYTAYRAGAPECLPGSISFRGTDVSGKILLKQWHIARISRQCAPRR